MAGRIPRLSEAQRQIWAFSPYHLVDSLICIVRDAHSHVPVAKHISHDNMSADFGSTSPAPCRHRRPDLSWNKNKSSSGTAAAAPFLAVDARPLAADDQRRRSDTGNRPSRPNRQFIRPRSPSSAFPLRCERQQHRRDDRRRWRRPRQRVAVHRSSSAVGLVSNRRHDVCDDNGNDDASASDQPSSAGLRRST